MQMVRHIVDGNELLFLTGDDASDVFLKFVIVLRLDEILPAFHREHDMNVDLCVGVGHARKMSQQICRAYGAQIVFCPGSTNISRLRRCFQKFVFGHSYLDIRHFKGSLIWRLAAQRSVCLARKFS